MSRPCRLALACALAASVNAYAQSFSRVADINTSAANRPVSPKLGVGSAEPTPDIAPGAGGVALFVGWSPLFGFELWRTDGTSLGTTLVKDIRPGSASAFDGASASPRLVAVGASWFFCANDGATGLELWVSDGTAAGTRLVRDIQPGPASSSPGSFKTNGARAFFAATDPTRGNELFSSDGTSAGTVVLIDANPLLNGSSPIPTAVVGVNVYFSATESTGARQVYVSDGTVAGTRRLSVFGAGLGVVADAVAGPGPFVLFSAFDATGLDLWRSDGTVAGTVRLRDATPGAPNPQGALQLTTVGGATFFSATGPAGDTELWRTDGGISGATLVKDVCPGFACSGTPQGLAGVNGKLYFFGTTDAGVEPWVSDGTTAGTFLLADINAGGLDSRTADSKFTAAGSRVAFEASEATVGLEPWVTDGTSLGTALLKNIAPSNASGGARFMTALGPNALFASNETGLGLELWSTDGTTANTARVRTTGPMSSRPTFLTPVSSTRMFFLADDGIHGVEPWWSDGTAGGTSLLADFTPGSGSTFVRGAWRLGDRVILSAYRAADGYEPWVVDADGGIRQLRDVWAGAGSGFGTDFVVAADAGYFIGTEATGQLFIYRTDGTPAGTVPVVSLGGQTAVGEFAAGAGGLLFLTSYGLTTGAEPYVATVADGGFRLLRDLNTGVKTAGGSCGTGTVPNDSNAGAFIPLLGTTYFSAIDQPAPSVDRRLYRTDGTSAGTQVAASTVVITGRPVVTTNRLYAPGFTVAGTTGVELFRFEPSDAGFSPVVDLTPGSGSTAFGEIVAAGDLVFFAAETNQGGGMELYRTDGTVNGTLLLKDINPGDAGSFPTNLRAVAGRVYFSATTPATGEELWVSDGTPAGTFRLTDINPDAGPSSPGPVAATSLNLFFAAYDSQEENELYASTSDFTPPVITPVITGTQSGGVYSSVVNVTFDVVDNESTATPGVGCGPATVSTDGTTQLTCTASSAGGSATKTVIILRDTTPPVPTCPDVTVEATGPNGALATFSPTAIDVLDPAPTVKTVPASGTAFAPGVTTVTGTATDRAGNAATCTFKVTVVDTTPPTLTCPAGFTSEATSPSGTPVTYTVMKSDLVDPAVVISSDHASGSAFPIGTTAVHVTATDASNNTSTCTFYLTVKDTTPPNVTCPPLVMLEATGPGGATTGVTPTVSDNGDPNPTVTSVPPAGATYPIGTTKTTVTATDQSGNSVICRFDVVVSDTKAPVPKCPAPIVVEATNGTSARVDFTATADDAVDPNPTIKYSRSPGSTFGLGVSTVEVTVQDSNYNVDKCTFTITVVLPGEVDGGTGGGGGTTNKPCGCTSAADLSAFGLVALAARGLSRRRRARP